MKQIIFIFILSIFSILYASDSMDTLITRHQLVELDSTNDIFLIKTRCTNIEMLDTASSIQSISIIFANDSDTFYIPRYNKFMYYIKDSVIAVESLYYSGTNLSPDSTYFYADTSYLNFIKNLLQK